MKRPNSPLVSKLIACALPLTSLCTLPQDSLAGDITHDGRYIASYNFNIGYEYVDLGEEFKFNHKNHPDDGFLSGSPGSTSVENGHALTVGAELSKTLAPFEPYIGLDALFFLDQGDRHKNDNDPRPDSNAAFVYSKVSVFGAQADLGLRWYPFEGREMDVKGFSLGLGLKGTLLGVEHGWDRYAHDESVSRDYKFLLNAGPTLGYKSGRWSVEGGFFPGIGNKTKMGTLRIGYGF